MKSIANEISSRVWAGVETFVLSNTEEKVQQELRSRARSLPSMLRTSGLVVSLAFLHSKGSERAGDKWMCSFLYSSVRSQVPKLDADLLEFFTSADGIGTDDLAEASWFAAEIADHLKRAAEVLIAKPEAES